MSLRFSLLGLIGLTTLAGLGCAALAQPGPAWMSVVVTLTAGAFLFFVLRLMLTGGDSRAAAVGWLVFAIAYLWLAMGPWLGELFGPQLLSSKALVYAQVNWRHEQPQPSPGAPLLQQYLDVNLNGIPVYDGTSSTILIGSSWQYTVPPTLPVANVNYFQISGHWLCAWLAGWLGATLAVQFRRRVNRPAACATLSASAASLPPSAESRR